MDILRDSLTTSSPVSRCPNNASLESRPAQPARVQWPRSTRPTAPCARTAHVTVLDKRRIVTTAVALDDAMPNAGIACYLPTTGMIRQFLKEWKCLSEFFSVENFLHLDLSGLHLFAFQPERRGTIMGSIFKLKNPGRAIVSEEDYRNVIHIPRSAMVVLIGGNIDEDPFVKIRHSGRVLLMLAEDLRNGGEPWGRLA